LICRKNIIIYCILYFLKLIYYCGTASNRRRCSAKTSTALFFPGFVVQPPARPNFPNNFKSKLNLIFLKLSNVVFVSLFNYCKIYCESRWVYFFSKYLMRNFLNDIYFNFFISNVLFYFLCKDVVIFMAL
jgi:hypothetical protein